MEIKAKFIGSKQWSVLLSKWIDIKRGEEDFYQSIGFIHILERKKPKLIKNAKNTEAINFKSDSDSNGTDNS